MGVSIERKDTRPQVSALDFKKGGELKAESMSGTVSTFAAQSHSAVSFNQTMGTSRSESTYNEK